MLPEIGIAGQKRLLEAKVLIIGAGGLGALTSMYLAGAGVGTIGIVDADTVDESNLHRQIFHSEQRLGIPKVESAKLFLSSLNSKCQAIAHNKQLTSQNAISIIQPYDLVVDASDNAPTRYLVSDWCVLLGMPLVSASALKWEGHITVYNNGVSCPCYRCLFPVPPPAKTVTNCSEGGILGPVAGLLGSLQAIEAIKVLVKNNLPTLSGHMVIFDALQGTFRKATLLPRRKDCQVCGESPSIKAPIDCEVFCGSKASDKREDEIHNTALSLDHRITWQEYKNEMLDQNTQHFLLDVRDQATFSRNHLDN